MKSATRLVEEFIEDLVRGDIESYAIDIASNDSLDARNLEGFLKDFRVSIIAYRQAKKPADKSKQAEDVLDAILYFRLNAVLKNNPNVIKSVVQHRDFYKSRAITAEERVKDLEDKLTSAYESNQKLQAMLEDARKGRPGTS